MAAIWSYIQSLASKETARIAAYGGAVALAAASWVAKWLGVDLPAEVITGIQAIAIFVITEVIRHFVTAPGNL